MARQRNMFTSAAARSKGILAVGGNEAVDGGDCVGRREQNVHDAATAASRLDAGRGAVAANTAARE